MQCWAASNPFLFLYVRRISGTRTHCAHFNVEQKNHLFDSHSILTLKKRLNVFSSKYNKNCLNQLSWRHYASFSLISTAFATEDLQGSIRVPWVRYHLAHYHVRHRSCQHSHYHPRFGCSRGCHQSSK